MKKKKKIKLNCEYCFHFQFSNGKRYEDGKVRKCIEKEVHTDDNICNSFLITSYIWCKKEGMRLSIEICLKKNCKRCFQRILIEAGLNFVPVKPFKRRIE